jgi:hypothetical protein
MRERAKSAASRYQVWRPTLGAGSKPGVIRTETLSMPPITVGLLPPLPLHAVVQRLDCHLRRPLPFLRARWALG